MSSTAAQPALESGANGRCRVLIVDDDEAIAALFTRALTAKGVLVQWAPDGRQAARLLEKQCFDAIVTDVAMPEMNGVELLQVIRGHDLDVPVIFVTGAPDIASAKRAVEYGAFRYLEKPVTIEALTDAVDRAVQVHELARIKRRAMALLHAHAAEASDRAGLMRALTDALGALSMHFQPIVRRSTRSVVAYEALVRSSNSSLSNPSILLEAGERLGRMMELGRTIRERVARIIPSVPVDQSIFVNVHPLELADQELYSPEAPLSAHAARVVLEITERASLDDVGGLDERVADLRSLGYRLAVDDFGAGYAGLTSFMRLNPEFVKVDMSLVRDLHRCETKRVLVRSALDLCREMSKGAIVEGVETAEELRSLSVAGADLMQGYLFGRPQESLHPVNLEWLDP